MWRWHMGAGRHAIVPEHPHRLERYVLKIALVKVTEFILAVESPVAYLPFQLFAEWRP